MLGRQVLEFCATLHQLLKLSAACLQWVVGKNLMGLSIQWEISRIQQMEVMYHIYIYKAIFCGDIQLHRPEK